MRSDARGRSGTILRATIGLTAAIGITAWFVYSSLPIPWESEDQPHVYSITWRSGLMFVLILLVCEAIVFLLFGKIFAHKLNDVSVEPKANHYPNI